MSKLNRRDYLKKMGATALLATTPLKVFEQKSRLQKSPQRRPKGVSSANTVPWGDLRWPATPVSPQDQTVTVLFRGLMAFCYNNNRQAEIGVHKGRNKHIFDITVFEKVNQKCYLRSFIPAEELTGNAVISLGIESLPSDIMYYHKDGFDRRNSTDYKDFGWLLDMEAPDFHPDGVDLETAFFKKKIFLRQGVFYTHQLSNSSFNRVNVGDTNSYFLARVPRLIAADFSIPSGKEASLSVNGKLRASLPYIAGVTYEVQFSNECFNSGNHCTYFPTDPDPNHEDKRSDFYMHRDAFKPKNVHDPNYGLKIQDVRAEVDLNMCSFEAMGAGSDQAPCMGVGYGKSGGL